MERKASLFSSFPVLVLPCAFSQQLKSSASSQPEDFSCLILHLLKAVSQVASAIISLASNVQGGRACVTRCTGTKCEPSKLIVCFGQKNNCVRFVI